MSGWESKLSAEKLGAQYVQVKDRTLVTDGVEKLSSTSNYLNVNMTVQLLHLMLGWLRHVKNVGKCWIPSSGRTGNVGNVGKCWIPSTRRTGLPAGRQKWHNQDSGMSNLKMLVIVIIFIIIIATVSIVVNFIFIVITIKRKAIRTWEGLYSTRCQRWGKGKGRRRFLVKSNNCVNVQDRCKEWKNVLHMFSFMAWRSWVVERRVTHKK